MSPADIAATVRARLAAELEAELSSVDKLAASIATLAATAGETMRALAMAFQIERYYTAAEALLTRVLRTIDGDVPAGEASHQELLRAASVPVEGLRAAIISPAVYLPLRELLAFRHYARHGYDLEPKAARVDEITKVLLDIHPVFAACVRQFITSLSAV